MKTCALLLSLLLTMAGCPAWADGEVELVTGPDRRHEIDLRIEALDARRAAISTTGPKAATIAGLGMAVVGGIVMGVSLSTYSGSNDEDESGELIGFFVGTVVLGLGGVTALTGGVIWGQRVGRRNEIDAERESLIEKRDGLAGVVSRLELRSEYRSDTRFLTLGARF